jgi:hypothetical protein
MARSWLNISPVTEDIDLIEEDGTKFFLGHAERPTTGTGYKAICQTIDVVRKATEMPTGAALNPMMEKVFSVTDWLSFQTMLPVEVIQVKVFDNSPGLKRGDKRKLMLFPKGYPSALSRVIYMGSPSFSGKVDTRIFSKGFSPRIARSSRWLTKGLKASNPIDEFISYWIALEILSPILAPTSKVFFRCNNCKQEVRQCPKCGSSTEVHPDTKRRLQDFVEEHLRKQGVFSKIWDMRNLIFHGETELTLEETNAVLNRSSELRAIVVSGMKQALGLKETEPPLIASFGPPTLSPFLYLNMIQDVDSDTSEA